MNIEKKKKIIDLVSKIKEKLFDAKKLTNEHKDITSILSEVWNLSKEKFVLETKLKDLKKYKGIIFTIGFTPEPIILNILANNPECVYFIYTKESEHILDSIIEETSLKPTQYKRELMSRDSAADSYNLVKKGLKFLTEEKKLVKQSIALDPTGGTKIMSVGCGIAASIFNIDILYVNNTKYNPTLKRPEPGTELLINISNPFDIYQDDKILEGLNFLRNLDFMTAKNIFDQIKNSSTNPLFPEFLSIISGILYFWDMIDYKNALNFLNKSKALIVKLSDKISSIQKNICNYLDSWSIYLNSISTQINEGSCEVEKISPLLIYDIKANADRDFYKSLYNNAALKYYRVTEMISQYILKKQYNFDTQNPKYENLTEETKKYLKKVTKNNNLNIEQTILNQYNDLLRNIYHKISPEIEYKESMVLPARYGLIAGHILRYILGDQSITNDFIFSTYQAIEERNKSIFAHGINSISKKNCERLKSISEKMISKIEIDEKLKSYVFNQKSIYNLVELLNIIL